ncbi:hypothetical protein BH09PSE5_BH09PSE5_16850 [soil metagenome]
MHSPADPRSAARPVPHAAIADEPKREPPELRSAKRDMRLLEELRKLRRDRAELLMREAQLAVAAAQQLVAESRRAVAGRMQRYEDAQVAVSAALDSGGRSLDEIRKLLDRVDRTRVSAHDAQSTVSALLREQSAAQVRAKDASRLTQAAAAAHEKVLEWKKAV